MKQSKVIAILLAISVATSFSLASVQAATPTSKATPKPSVKATVKATAKPTVKAVATKKATPTKKATATKKATPTKKATATKKATTSKKPVVKKPVVKKPKKKVVKKTATPIPSPSPVWPPVKFTENKGVYAKIPTGKEILGLISAKSGLATDVQKCEANACGAVIVAANFTCQWWEIKSTVMAPDPNDSKKSILLGTLRTTHGLLKPNTYANILLISDEPLYTPGSLDPTTGVVGAPVLRPRITVGNISAICHKSATDEKLPSNTYLSVR
jgi:hypothetical protein